MSAHEAWKQKAIELHPVHVLYVDGLEILMPPCGGSLIGWVYFIHAKELGLIKVGYSSERDHDVPIRFSQIQVASPVKLEREFSICGTLETEKALHAHFADFRRQGEWFEAQPVLQFIEKIRAAFTHAITNDN